MQNPYDSLSNLDYMYDGQILQLVVGVKEAAVQDEWLDMVSAAARQQILKS
jgi:hypothetical protein